MFELDDIYDVLNAAKHADETGMRNDINQALTIIESMDEEEDGEEEDEDEECGDDEEIEFEPEEEEFEPEEEESIWR